MIKSKEVYVYGGGISGLIAAYALTKKGFLVRVIDPYDKPKLGTLHLKEGLVELAANSILHNEAVKNLLEDIGLSYELYSSLGKKKFIYSKEKGLRRWPLSFKESLRALPSLLALAFKSESLKPKKYESLKSWGEQHLSKELLHNILAQGLKGVYGKNTLNLSASLVLKRIFVKNKKRSLGSLSFEKGMLSFVQAFKEHLEKLGVDFLKSEPSEEEQRLRGVIKVVSTPAFSTPDFVSKKNKALLNRISYQKVSTVTLFFKEPDRLPFRGFGCIFDGFKGYLGLISNTDLFSKRSSPGLVSETWILDGELFQTEKTTLNNLLIFRKERFKKEAQPVRSHFYYWEKAFPYYDVCLEEVLEDLEPQPDVFFFANWTGDLGIGSMIEKSEKFALKLESLYE